jgi:hypothetical protein
LLSDSPVPEHDDEHDVAGWSNAACPQPVAMGLTTPEAAARWLDELARDIRDHGEHAGLWPLLIGAWKRKEAR